MKKRNNQKKRIFKQGILTSSLIGTLGAIAVMLLIIASFSAIGIFLEKPHSYIDPLSYFAIYTAAFFGGFIATKKNKGHDALLCGLFCGVLLTAALSIIFLIIGLILDAQSTAISWLFRGLTVIFSIFGSLLSIKRKSKSKKRNRRR